jgi:hypothetical protein
VLADLIRDVAKYQHLPRDEGAVNIRVGALDVPAIEVVRTVEVPTIKAERTRAESTEGVRPPPAKEEAEEDEDEKGTARSPLSTWSPPRSPRDLSRYVPCLCPFVKLTCSWKCYLVTRVPSSGSCGYVKAGHLGAGQGECRPRSGGGARGQGGRARGAEPPSGGQQGQGRGCSAQGKARYVVGVMSAEFFVHCLVSDLLLFRAGGLHQGQRGAAEAPRGGRNAGGRHRGEASSGAGGSARYDPEIIRYVLFVMFFSLG